ncbi:hypothetical protein [Staphylothermus hellenicus]|uniref:Uncharacterized protein n=1 Tax=Staphylothermus hellenicus (strain DSM 12710 / JCM 10830 / BK20S6-10-b1 / P8) TaxID=591019 RepID=D7DBJ9_STAHD|nr:hypothetical protein [Staphylothermus hellenicus]ADI31546.1 hypothetical protein Shell_0415 [Staphylothermus hellenicus DSM 12710]
MSEKTSEEEMIEAETTKQELEAVAEFINKLKDTVKELLTTLVDSISGKKLGEDVASFYESLKNKGLPEDLAIKMTEEYFKKRLSTIPDIGSLMKQFTSMKHPEIPFSIKGAGLEEQGEGEKEEDKNENEK